MLLAELIRRPVDVIVGNSLSVLPAKAAPAVPKPARGWCAARRHRQLHVCPSGTNHRAGKSL
jgi:hypothetical protein